VRSLHGVEFVVADGAAAQPAFFCFSCLACHFMEPATLLARAVQKRDDEVSNDRVGSPKSSSRLRHQ
jgi:hypothetical protein